MIKIAYDTNCLNVKGKDKFLNELEDLEKKGKIICISSTVIEKEIADTNVDNNWREKYLERVNKMKKILETGYYRKSKFDNAVFGNEILHRNLHHIFSGIKDFLDSDFYDLWILETAITHKCDYFLTKNVNHFIKNGKKEEIEKLGIKVRIPNKEFIDEIIKTVHDI